MRIDIIPPLLVVFLPLIPAVPARLAEGGANRDAKIIQLKRFRLDNP
jgi:hypothetical protein